MCDRWINKYTQCWYLSRRATWKIFFFPLQPTSAERAASTAPLPDAAKSLGFKAVGFNPANTSQPHGRERNSSGEASQRRRAGRGQRRRNWEQTSLGLGEKYFSWKSSPWTQYWNIWVYSVGKWSILRSYTVLQVVTLLYEWWLRLSMSGLGWMKHKRATFWKIKFKSFCKRFSDVISKAEPRRSAWGGLCFTKPARNSSASHKESEIKPPTTARTMTNMNQALTPGHETTAEDI